MSACQGCPQLNGAFAKLKDQIGTTAAAAMRPEPVTYQDKPDGITMRHTDEKQPLIVHLMEALEGVTRARQHRVLGNLPAQFYQQMPDPRAKAPPHIHIPPPSPKETTYNDTDSEVYQPRSTLSGIPVGHHLPNTH